MCAWVGLFIGALGYVGYPIWINYDFGPMINSRLASIGQWADASDFVHLPRYDEKTAWLIITAGVVVIGANIGLTIWSLS